MYLEYTLLIRQQNDSADYWNRQLNGASFKVDFKFAKCDTKSVSGKRHEFLLPNNLTDKLRDFISREKSTLFNVIASLYKILLYRYFNDKDILIGYPANIRPRTGDYHLLFGFYANTLILRAEITPAMSFRQLVQLITVQRKTEDLHRDYPVIDIGMTLARKQYLSIQSPFNIFLSSIKFSADFSLPQLSIVPIEYVFNESITDLGLYYSNNPTGIEFAIEYNINIFSPTFISAMAQNCITLIESALNLPDCPLTQLTCISSNEYHKVTVEWNNTFMPFPPDKTLHKLFEEQVDKMPQAAALIFGDKSMMYETLNTKANQLASFLQNCNVNPGDLVSISMNRSFELIIAILATLKVGGAYIPLNLSDPEFRLKHIIGDSKPKTLIISTNDAQKFTYYSQCIILLDTDHSIFSSMVSTNPTDIIIDSQQIANVVYTSGSTGKPKGVCVPHQGLVNQISWMQNEYRLTVNDKVLHKTPINFDVAGLEIFWPLLVGACLVVAEPNVEKDPYKLIETIQYHGINVIHFVPSALASCLQIVDKELVSSLRLVFSIGEALSARMVKLFFEKCNFELHNLYGPTEASIQVTYWACSRDSIYGEIIPIGKPIANNQMYCLDKYLQPVPVGVIGEICIGGIGLARCYLSRAQLTSEKFIKHPFSNKEHKKLYKTGDLGRFLEDGNIEYIGRIDYEFKFHGVRIHPKEIEYALNQYPSVKESLVALQKDKNGYEHIVAYLIRDNTYLENQFKIDLLSFLQERFPSSMIPSSIIALNNFNLLSNDKIDRANLPIPDANSFIKDNNYVAPDTELQKILLEIWSKVLGVTRIGITDHLFTLGGNSIRAIEIISNCRQQGIECDLKTLIEHPTVQQLSQYIECNWFATNRTLSKKHLFSIKTVETSNIPLILIHPAVGLSAIYYSLATYISNLSIYGINIPSSENNNIRYNSIEEMAENYIKILQETKSLGCYRLGGYSFGGLVAYEIGIQMEKKNIPVEVVIMIDTSISSNSAISEDEIDSAFKQSLKGITNIDQLDLFRKDFFHNSTLYRKYKPQKYQGKILLLDASKESNHSWLPYMHNRFIRKEIHGSHYQLFDPEYILPIAKHIQEILEKPEIGVDLSSNTSHECLSTSDERSAIQNTDSIKEILEDGILIIQFNDAQHHNPFNKNRQNAVKTSLLRANSNIDIKAIIITGGKNCSFSSGGDFNETKHFSNGTDVDDWIERLIELYKTPLVINKPVIAAIEGHAIGIGFRLAMMCDWRIGTATIKLRLPELKNGLSCTLGTSILNTLIGLADTQKIVYSCDIVP